MSKVLVGSFLSPRQLQTIKSEMVVIPSPGLITHLQFRRFAGCPMCNLHIHSFIQHYDQIKTAGIQEVAVFYSTVENMREQHAEAPFALVADPNKALYRAFGVESGLLSVMHPRAWLPAILGVFKIGMKIPQAGESFLGLPADFLIDENGKVLACKYGSHAYDHWSIEELLELAAEFTK